MKKRLGNRLLPYYFLAPAIVFLLLFMAYPTLNVFYYSLQNYATNKPYMQGFVGLDNIIKVLTQDSTFRTSLVISLKWVVTQVSLQLVFGLIIALVLNQTFRGRGVLRAIVFAPWAVSGVLTSMMWSLMYNENMGVINDLLMKLGIIDKGIAWISGYETSFAALTIAELWRGIPFFAIMLLAGLQSIPFEEYEACAVDGGTRWSKFLYITLPHLKETIVLSTLLRAVWEFNNVDVIYNLTGGSPVNSTMTLTMYVTQTAIRDSNFGYGSAIAVVSFVILAVFATVYIKLTGFAEERQA